MIHLIGSQKVLLKWEAESEPFIYFFHRFQCLLWIQHITTILIDGLNDWKQPNGLLLISSSQPWMSKLKKNKIKYSITQISNCLSKTIFPSPNDSISAARVIWSSPWSLQTVVRGNAKEAAGSGCSLMWFHFSEVIQRKDYICMQKRHTEWLTWGSLMLLLQQACLLQTNQNAIFRLIIKNQVSQSPSEGNSFMTICTKLGKHDWALALWLSTMTVKVLISNNSFWMLIQGFRFITCTLQLERRMHRCS